MTSSGERWVHKVHPLARAAEPEDPLTLHATPVAGDPEVMLHCLVQEYAWMGWEAEEILRLFRDPFYPALHALWRLFGEAGLRERVTTVLKQTGTWRLDADVREEPEPDVGRISNPSPCGTDWKSVLHEEESELVQLGIRSSQSDVLKGESYAAGL
jgi:hypothetical protein